MDILTALKNTVVPLNNSIQMIPIGGELNLTGVLTNAESS
jgi:hypothetical protein